MNNYSTKAKKALSTALVAVTTAWTIGASALIPMSAKAAVSAGTLVKASLPAVYYVGTDGKRYVFPNEKTYKTWFADFSGVQTITDAELASMVIGGNVTYRPGVKMVKITTDPKVYAVDAHGTLRHIASESVAVALYGSNWNTKIDDVSDAFFVNYTLGSAINNASEFNISAITAAASSISVDKQLTAVSGAVSVSLDSSNPAAASIIADGSNGGQARIPALALKFQGTGTVDTLKLKRIGINADQDIDNVYLYEGNNFVAEMQSISAGVITFNNPSGLFTVNGSKTLTVKFDLDDNTSSGKTIGFGLNAASDLILDGGSNGAGTFPFNGNLMTVASVSDLGRAQLTNIAVSTAVDPGTADFEAMRFQVQGSNQDLKLNMLRLKMIGSINSEDIANIRLFDGATQIASTAALTSDKMAIFDMSAAPFLIGNGLTKQLTVRIQVKGGSTRTIQFSIEKPYDFDVTDANYNVPINPDNGTVGSFSVINSTSVTVNAGSLTVNTATTSPTGVAVLNGTAVKLAKFELNAVGESIKVNSVDFVVSDEGDASGPADGSSNWTNIRNVRVMFDGSQVGTTQTSVADDTSTQVSTNFTVVPGSIHTLEIVADIASASGAADAIAAADSIRAYLNTGSSNAQRVASFGSVNFPSADTAGNTLTVAEGALTVVENSSLGAVTVVRSQTNQRVGSWLLTTNTSQGVDVTSIVLDDDVATASMAASFTNLVLKKDGVALAPVVIPNTSDAAGTDYTFSLSPALSIPANSTVSVDVYADILSGETWTDGEDLRLVSSTGTGKITGTTVSGTANVDGQDITVSAAGTLALSVDGSSPVGSQHVLGSTAKTLGIWKFEADNTEDLSVSQIIVHNDNSTTGNGNIKNIKLFVGGVQVGSTISALNGSGDATFGGLNITVPRASSTLVTVKADFATFTEAGSAGVGDLVRLEIALPATINEDGTTDTVVARGASGTFASVTSGTEGDKTAENMFPYRTTLASSIACSSSCSARTRGSNDTIGKLTLNGGGTTDAQFRPALQLNDEADGGAAGNDWVATGTANSFTTNNVVDGTNSLRITEDGASAVADHSHYDFGTSFDLGDYSRLAFWINSSAAKAANDLTIVLSQTADTTDNASLDGLGTNPITFNVPALSAGADTFVNLSLSGADSAVTYRFMTINVAANPDNAATIDIDAVRFYNDSINVDLAGSLGATTTVDTLLLSMKDNGGTTRGVAYVDGSSTAAATALITFGDDIGSATAAAPASGLLSIGSSAQVFDLQTNTTTLLATETTATESLSVSLDLGNAGGTGSSSTAGDFRWWDQGVTATSPINFLVLGGSGTPITINMGY